VSDFAIASDNLIRMTAEQLQFWADDAISKPQLEEPKAALGRNFITVVCDVPNWEGIGRSN